MGPGAGSEGGPQRQALKGSTATGCVLQIDYPEIAEGIMPRHRFMSAYEQRIEPPDRRWQYLLMAAEPYETIAFKVASPLVSPCSPMRGESREGL